ncbi:hypothetical protein GMOD_00006157 [Pyrenophora seminiperda CCB06]|uniref:Uncharacterized protein n=1 Tax=Pyrenophora seminiperda CCB06 TaxID=1302712 RepID=A0A3M7M4H2_9PLEO|nr:hypothetical protein GMOD_00006157 [Pyrenophora seminiperda CCB06]
MNTHLPPISTSMCSSKTPRASNKSGSCAATSAGTTSSALALAPKRSNSKAKMAWKEICAARKDKAIVLDNIFTNMQSIAHHVGAAPNFADKSEVMDMITLCKDVIKDLYEDAQVETERAQKAYKALGDEDGDVLRQKETTTKLHVPVSKVTKTRSSPSTSTSAQSLKKLVGDASSPPKRTTPKIRYKQVQVPRTVTKKTTTTKNAGRTQ